MRGVLFEKTRVIHELQRVNIVDSFVLDPENMSDLSSRSGKKSKPTRSGSPILWFSVRHGVRQKINLKIVKL